MMNKKLFSNLFLIIFIIWLIKLFFYAVELKEISIYLSSSLIILISFLIIISLIYIFRNFDKKKFIITINFFISFFLLILTSLIYDFYKDYLNNINKLNQLKKRANIAKELNINFEKRTKIEFLNELKKKNKNTSFAYNPSIILKEFSKNKKIKNHILPLSGLSKTLVVDCNESGSYSTFVSDRYGFNNYDSIYKNTKKRIILIGDSLIQGQCVNQSNTIANKLNNDGYNVISLGLAGNGPLLELAILKEYGVKLNPSKVIWFFSENDIRDLEKNSKFEILKKYYNKNYTQGNIEKQIETDQFWKIYEKEEMKKKNKNTKKNFLKKIERAIFLKSYKDLAFELFKDEYIEYKEIDSKYINKFIEIIKLSKHLTEEHGAEFYFVYLPLYKSILNEEPKSKEIILNEIKKLNISYLDFHKVIKKFEDPLIFFPFKIEGHYTINGYELLAEKIKNKFLE